MDGLAVNESGSVSRKKNKNYHFHESGKVRRSNDTPIKLLSVDYFDLKTLANGFGNDILIGFEIQR